MEDYEKTGYLAGPFKYFHLITQDQQEFHFHYHDFHKLLFFLQGDVRYQIEGRSFSLIPGDLVLIPAGEIHRPVLERASAYDRIILYLAPDPLACGTDALPSPDLGFCFQKARKEQLHVLRLSDPSKERLLSLFAALEEEQKKQAQTPDLFASGLYQQALLTEILVLLNRAVKKQQDLCPESLCENPLILRILEYLNQNLKEDLSVDSIASRFFLSRYHLMRLFKQYTGYTLGQYISLKRLLYARQLLRKGTPPGEVCYLCGYRNYSAFSRAYKKQFQVSPKKK